MHSSPLKSSLGRFLASRWMLYGPTLLIAAALAIGGIYLKREYDRKQKAARPEATATVTADPLGQSFSGKLKAQKTVLIPAPIDGTLESIEATDGEEVYEGQLLGRIQNTALDAHKQRAEEDLERLKGKLADIESQTLAARLEASRASAELARLRSEYEMSSRNYERQQKLFREGAAARKTFERAEEAFRKLTDDLKGAEESSRAADRRVAALQANLEETRQKLNDQTAELEDAEAELLTGEVKAPVAGLLIGHRKSAGEEVTRDIEDLFEIAVDLTAMEVVVELPAQVTARIQTGGSSLVQVAEAGQAPLNGKIREIRDGIVVVEFVSPSPAIRPGMSAQVRFLDR